MGTAVVTVSRNGKEIQKTTFRVKLIPDPVPEVAGMKGGDIAKQKLLNAKEVVVVMGDFDFDFSFDIVEFSVATILDGFVHELKSNSNKITEKQKEIIAKTSDGTAVYFQEIRCKGPDGTVRNLPVVAFRITE